MQAQGNPAQGQAKRVQRQANLVQGQGNPGQRQKAPVQGQANPPGAEIPHPVQVVQQPPMQHQVVAVEKAPAEGEGVVDGKKKKKTRTQRHLRALTGRGGGEGASGGQKKLSEGGVEGEEASGEQKKLSKKQKR